MQLILKIDPSSKFTLQSQLISQFHTLIKSGQLKPSSLIPSTRELSLQLKVSRNTISEVYDTLIEEGYLVTKHKVGTFITDKLPENSVYIPQVQTEVPKSKRPSHANLPLPYSGKGQSGLHRVSDSRLIYDFALGRTDIQSFPEKTWRRLLIDRLGGAAINMSNYHDPAGLPDLRQLIANLLGPTRAMVVSKEQVLIVAGCQQGLSLAAHMFIDNHMPVVVEAPCYRGAAYLIESYGGKIIKVPVDEFGLDINKLPDHPVKLVYVTPSHQFPTGVTMSLERRLALLEWAAKNKVYILEVDYDVNFRYEDSPLPSLWSLDKHNCVIYMSSFSRSLGPGLRLGYVVVPTTLIEPAIKIRSLLDNGSPWLEQATLEQFIQSGSFDKHLFKLRHNNLLRRDALVSSLKHHFGDVKISGTEAGMHLLWHLGEKDPSAKEMQQIAKTCGVGVYPLEDSPACFFEEMQDREKILLLGYNHMDESRIRTGIATLANAFYAGK
jgi:GntR family transcriptional regulator / MocR family aminotransferase